jgi:NAD(P)-dependent dehydrogenase (short-subunit alcohol dehydrogenase family)
MKRFTGKVVIVTGSTRHIGKGIAKRFAREGAHVVINGVRSAELVQQIAADIENEGGSAIGVQADVSKAEDVSRLFDETLSSFGTVDVLVNNAGLVATRGHFLDTDEAKWDSILGVNLKGVIMCAHRAACIMRDHGHGGSIINISSVGAPRGHFDNAIYDSTKGGVESFTRSVSLDLARYGIRVNCIGPGAITDMNDKTEPPPMEWIPIPRAGTPDDIGGMAAFLASEDASYITGQVFYVDGGMLAQLNTPWRKRRDR